MPLLPLNSVGGYSTGITGTAVIDANGNITGVGATFSGLARFNAGISAAGGITFNSNVTINSANTLIASTIQSEVGKNQLDIANTSNSRVAIGDYNGAANSTYIFLRDATNSMDISNPYGIVNIGDPNGIDSGAYISYEAAAGELNGNGSSIVNFDSGSFNSISLFNGEYIRNSTNGRIDFMPAPSGSTHYGLYVDTTSWGYGPRLGTIRSSDNALNTAFILWDAPLVIGTNVDLSVGSSQVYKFRATLPGNGNSTLQIGVGNALANYSGAVAIMDTSSMGNTAARAPGVSHANPNLYVYRAGASRANDFIRVEHNGDFGRIISGGTSGISIESGSGIVGVSGGISASSGMTLTGTFNLNGQTFTNVVHSINGFTGAIGAARWPIGQTSASITVLTFPSGTTSFGTKIPYYIPHQNVSGAGTSTGTVTANRVYFTLFHTPRDINLHTLRINAFSTGITGNCHFGVYDVDPNSGFPKNLRYSSASIAVASGFGSTTVSNASGLVSVPAGYFYIATVFNNTPSMYGLNISQLPIFGADTYTSGYLNSSPFADPGGFTLPNSLPSSGITFGFIDYIPSGPVRGMFVDYRIV